jgi:Holliday junction resolvase RusA-like endonuclease
MILTIKGIPKPKQSVRSKVIQGKNGKPFVMHYQSNEVKQEESNIQTQVLNQLPIEFRPITITIAITKLHYIFPIPASFNKKQIAFIESGGIIYKGTKPDLTDNLNKGLFDALQGIVFINDSLIVSIDNVKKYYGFIPQTILELEVVPPPTY